MKGAQLAAITTAIWASVVVYSAGPASAEALAGPYTAAIGSGTPMIATWVFTPCGPDCTNAEIGPGNVRQLRLQGNTWKWSEVNDGVTCITTIDNTTLAGSYGCVPMTLPLQLTRG